MQLRYRYRIYPTPGQRRALAQAFGNARVVFNDAVRARQTAHAAGEKFPSGTQLQKRLITDAKKTPERAWLANAQHSMLQQAIRDCDQAYKNFFDSLRGARVGRKVGAPRFKSRKDNRQAIRFQPDGFRVLDTGKLRVSKIGDVPVAWSRDLPSAPSSVTVVKTADGRYFASFVVEAGDETLPDAVDADGNEVEIGLDLGLSAFAVDQHGRVIDNPRFLRRAERKLKRLQRALSRKQRGSNNRRKARKKLARAHAKVSDTRQDWLHQATTSIVRENQTIVLEDLAVSGLARTRLAKSVHDASWGTFRRLLEEKAARYGRELVIIDRWLPTSQTCSDCGRIDGTKPLSVRTWSCPCGAAHDRDRNAARTILAAGRAERQNACGPDVRPHTGADGDEAGTQRSAAPTQQRITAPQGGEDVNGKHVPDGSSQPSGPDSGNEPKQPPLRPDRPQDHGPPSGPGSQGPPNGPGSQPNQPFGPGSQPDQPSPPDSGPSAPRDSGTGRQPHTDLTDRVGSPETPGDGPTRPSPPNGPEVPHSPEPDSPDPSGPDGPGQSRIDSPEDGTPEPGGRHHDDGDQGPGDKGDEEYRRRVETRYGTSWDEAVADLRADHPELDHLPDEEAMAVRRYVGGDASTINDTLRNGDAIDREYMSREVEHLREGLDKLPGHTPTPDNPVVYRDLHVSPEELPKLLERYTPGETVEEAGFTSASKEIPPEMFGDQPGFKRVEMIIDEPEHAADLEKINPDEREVLWKNDNQFTVNDVDQAPDGTWQIRLTDVGPKGE